jgi:hypothetical protein
MLRTKLLCAGLAVALGLALSAPASAGLIPTLVTVLPNADGTFRWAYNVVVTSDVSVKTGDGFTIYDFMTGGVPVDNSQPANWAMSEQMLGKTPSQTNPSDDPTIPNFTFTYTGQDPIAGPQGLGSFEINSKFGSPANSDFTSLTHRLIDGKSEHNITTTNVPVAAAAPEPATLALFGIGLPAVGAARLLRRKRAA